MKVVVQCSAGMGPDLIDHISASSIQTYQTAGILADLTDDAKRLGFGIDTLPECIRPFVQVATVMPDGEIEMRQYVYPCNLANAFLFYNKNVFDQLGVPYPPEEMTWDEYETLAKKLTVKKDGALIPEIFGASGLAVESLIWGLGGDFMNPEGTRSLLDSDAVIDAMTQYHRYLHVENIEPTPVQAAGVASHGANWGSGSMMWFGEGKVGLFWGQRYQLIQFRRQIASQRELHARWEADGRRGEEPQVLRFGAVQVPHFPGQPIYSGAMARCSGINAKSPRREAALTFMQYLAGADYAKITNQTADAFPGNAAYYRPELLINPEYDNEDEAECAREGLKALNYGRTPPRSVFVNFATAWHFFGAAREKIISRSDLTRDDISAIMQDAARRVNLEIARNISREPFLKLAYEKLLSHGAEPTAIAPETVN
jgi:ABC-type glycerol-3-phosphate transport system substrate-binding protein